MVPDTCATSGGAGPDLRQAADGHSAPRAASASNGGTTLGRMAIKDGLLAEFDHEMGTTRRLLDRLPDEKLSWKPHEKSMSLGGLATHLSSYWLTGRRRRWAVRRHARRPPRDPWGFEASRS